MTCLNSRKWSGFHWKKAVSICHKSSQQCSSSQKWQIYPSIYWSNFSHFLVFSLSDVSLLVCAHLFLCRWHPRGVSGFPPKWSTMLWQSGAAGGAEGHGDRAEHLCCHGELWNSWMYLTLLLHLLQKAVTYLSQGHQCPTLPDASHQRRELRNSAVINNLIYPLELIFFPSIFNFMFGLPAALAH